MEQWLQDMASGAALALELMVVATVLLGGAEAAFLVLLRICRGQGGAWSRRAIWLRATIFAQRGLPPVAEAWAKWINEDQGGINGHPVKVIVKENLYRWTNWKIVASTQPYEKQDARTVHFPVTVPADKELVVRYTVRYTW